MKTPSIVFEDNQIIVALKPPGVLSQADGSAAPDMLTLLKADLKIRYNKPGQVYLGLLHRLDQPVGGLMVFARTSKAASRLSAQIREHKLAKTYLAVVHGLPEPELDTLEDSLHKDAASNLVRVVPAGQGQAASLEYAVLQKKPDVELCLLAIRLWTGRSHQIRVQLASRGWPIAGDRRYGRQDDGQADIALFAAGLGFFHPVAKNWLEFYADLPDRPPWNAFNHVDMKSVKGCFLNQV